MSFLQTPAWAQVKPEWRASRSAGSATARSWAPRWCSTGSCRGQALPGLPARGAGHRLGPDDLGAWLRPMAAHLKAQGAFGVRIGPPVVTRRWSAAQVKDGIADPAVRRLDEVAPLERSPVGARVVAQLDELGWRPQAAEGGFAAGQPQYNFWIPLGRGRHRGRRPQGHEPAVAAQHQEGRQGGGRGTSSSAAAADLKAFHDLYVHTAGARPLHPAAAVLLRGHVRRAARRGPRPDPALARPPRGRPGRGHHRDPGRHPRLVLLRRLLDREARRPRLQRDPVGDDPRRARGRRRRLRPARHHRHPRRRRPPRRADPVQGRHRRRGRRVRRRVGPAAQPAALQGVRHSTWKRRGR